ncbi:GFA family protein [Vreelandella malpeensis]|uniref:GFA family protein n=1 Tax=Vreelandella malpeensis TaxID=1172368 RepID=A0ABS8DVF6_9GAMM|nr:GFA family protein [Halomonas malpeensis]MCB8890319.1 GFA family protein [Halomonas malpeensis]
MTTRSELRGQCLCGAVRLTAIPTSLHVDACHCQMCRRWGGGPMMVVECNRNLSFEGQQYIVLFGSSEWAERGFCRQCGTHLFFRLKDLSYCAVPVGLFEGSTAWSFTQQVFIEQKPAYYSFSEKTENLTGEELFAKHSQGS